MIKKVTAFILCAFVLTTTFVGCGERLEGLAEDLQENAISDLEENAQPKVFSVDELSITLNDSFKEETTESYNFNSVYVSPTIGIWTYKDAFENIDGDSSKISVEDYAKAYATSIDEGDTELFDYDGVINIVYEESFEDIDYTYLVCFYKSDSAFWTVQFSVNSEKYDNYKDLLSQYATSVDLK